MTNSTAPHNVQRLLVMHCGIHKSIVACMNAGRGTSVGAGVSSGTLCKAGAMGLRQVSGSWRVRMASSTMVHRLPASAPCPSTGTSLPNSSPNTPASFKSRNAACTHAGYLNNVSTYGTNSVQQNRSTTALPEGVATNETDRHILWTEV